MDANIQPHPGAAAAITIAELKQEYLDDLQCRVSPSHYKNVRSRLDRVIKALQVTSFVELQAVQVIRYRNQLRAAGAANRTANLCVDSISAMLSWALGCGMIAANPLRNLRRLPDGIAHQRYRRRSLTDAEIELFLKAAKADDEETAKRWAAMGGGAADHRRCGARVPQTPMWLAFLETGARWSELTRTRWVDWGLSDRTLVLRAENTKTKKRRVLPLRECMVTAIEELRVSQEEALGHPPEPNAPAFLTPEGAQWMRPTNNAMRLFRRVMERAGISRLDSEGRRLDIHSLRHTFGSRLARFGVGLVQVQRLMGHSDPKLTAQVYTHLDVEDLRRAVEAVEG